MSQAARTSLADLLPETVAEMGRGLCALGRGRHDLWKDFKQDHAVAASRRDTHIIEEPAHHFHGRNFRYGLLNVTMTTGGVPCREEISSDSGWASLLWRYWCWPAGVPTWVP